MTEQRNDVPWIQGPRGADSEDVASANLDATVPAVQLHNFEAEKLEIAAIRRRMIEDADGALEPAAVCILLGGISLATLEAKRTRLDLLGVPQKGRYMYPLCQFHEGAILPHLPEVLRAFQGASPWTMLSVLLAPTDALAGATPINALRAGRYAHVIGVAAGWGTTGGA